MTAQKDCNERIRENLREVNINSQLFKLLSGESKKITFKNHHEPNLRVITTYIKDAGYKIELEYFIPGLGYCVVRCNNIIGRRMLATEIIDEIVNISDLVEYEEENTIKDILDMEIDSIRFLPEALIDKNLFGDIFEKFDEAIEKVFGRKKGVTDSIKSEVA